MTAPTINNPEAPPADPSQRALGTEQICALISGGVYGGAAGAIAAAEISLRDSTSPLAGAQSTLLSAMRQFAQSNTPKDPRTAVYTSPLDRPASPFRGADGNPRLVTLSLADLEFLRTLDADPSRIPESDVKHLARLVASTGADSSDRILTERALAPVAGHHERERARHDLAQLDAAHTGFGDNPAIIDSAIRAVTQIIAAETSELDSDECGARASRAVYDALRAGQAERDRRRDELSARLDELEATR